MISITDRKKRKNRFVPIFVKQFETYAYMNVKHEKSMTRVAIVGIIIY